MIKKLAIPFALAAATMLTACAGLHDTTVVSSAETTLVASSTVVPIGGAVRPGAGKVVLLTDLQGPVADISSQRVTLKMKDGGTQSIYVKGEQLTMGEEVRILADNRIQREARM